MLLLSGDRWIQLKESGKICLQPLFLVAAVEPSPPPQMTGYGNYHAQNPVAWELMCVAALLVGNLTAAGLHDDLHVNHPV